VETPHLTIVIPAYNEKSRIAPTLERVTDYLGRQPWPADIIVVLDGSTDGTRSEIARVCGSASNVTVLDHAVNRGKGYAVRTGMLAATGRYVLFTDADLSTPIEEASRLLAALDAGADVAIGSRALTASNVAIRQPWWRESMGRTFNWFVQLLTVRGISDTQCGFKCFRREAAQRVFALQRLERFAFDVEVLWIAQRFGYRIVELPVTWRNDPSSTVNPLVDSTRMLLDLVRIRINDWIGCYNRPR
jgi:dolichyl-phosphate beta-glucosyltransferase